MLTFCRNKLVSIFRKDPHTLQARGILEDDIYGMELDVAISLPDLEIVAIQGRWTRMENSECPRAVPFLQEALRFRLSEEGFTQKVQKTVGRRSCRHFANILLECCEAGREAAQVLREQEEQAGREEPHGKNPPEKEIEAAKGPLQGEPEVSHKSPSVRGDLQTGEKDRGVLKGGMTIDLHVHCSEASPCSSAPLGDLVAEAKRIGLHGICLTDHNHVWDPAAVAELRQRYEFLILRGNEITTDQGDMIVFGLEEDIRGIIRLEALREKVLEAGGAIIAAHPFRGFLTFGIGQLGLTPEKAMERPLFRHVDAVEVLNSKVSERENRFSREVARGLGLPGTGGSDAHEVEEVGIYATRFMDTITAENELIAALKSDRYSPVAFRKQGGKGV